MNEKSKLEKEVTRLKTALLQQQMENRKLKEALAAEGNKTSGEAGKELATTKLWSNISHEILTPMDAILGMTDLVMETTLDDEQRNYLEMINASADRLFGVISDIIDYAEIVEGKLRQDTVNFDLYKELEYDLYIAQLTCRHNDLKFKASFGRDIPNYLNSDPGRLRQVLGNILSNAISLPVKVKSG